MQQKAVLWKFMDLIVYIKKKEWKAENQRSGASKDRNRNRKSEL